MQDWCGRSDKVTGRREASQIFTILSLAALRNRQAAAC